MKITVTVELAESEASGAPQVQHALAELSDSITTRVISDLPRLALFIREGSGSPKVETVVIPEIQRRLVKPELSADCLQTICDVVLSTTAVDTPTPLNVCMMVSRLQDPLRVLVKDALLSRVVDHLSQPREIDYPRRDTMPFAEAFGAMVKSELVPLKGAIAVIVELLLADRTRCAAITALGKVVEYVHDTLFDKIDRSTMEELRHIVSTCQENHFLYDVEYISEALGWSQSRTYVSSTLKQTLRHHKSPILAMAGYFDVLGSSPNVVVTASQDGDVATWDPITGTSFPPFTLDQRFACALDVIYNGTGLLLAAVGRQPHIAPSVVLYTNENGKWTEKGGCDPTAAKVVTAVRGLVGAQSFSFCAGIAQNNNTHILQIFDAGRGVIQPTREIRDHSDTITTLAVPSDNLIVSGSRDSTVMIHDIRSSHATINLMDHSSTVTGIGCVNNFVATAGLDRRVVLHDLRMTHQPVAQRDLDSAVLALSLSELGFCYVVTQGGLHSLNATTPGMPASFIVGAPSASAYNTIIAHPSTHTICCAGEGRSLDVLQVEQ